MKQILILLCLALLFLSGCAEVKQVKKINETEAPVLNLSPYLDVNTINLSLGVKLCDLIPPFENTKSPLADRWLCHNLHSWELYYCEDNVRPESHEICLLSMIAPDLDLSICGQLENPVLKSRCTEYINAVENSIFSKSTWGENNSMVCYYNTTSGRGCNNDNCICPEQYVKKSKSFGIVCIPRICGLIHSYNEYLDAPGGTLEMWPNQDECEDAFLTNRPERCDIINAVHDKDICIAAYIMKTRNLTACQLLNDSKLIEKCVNY